MRSTIGSTEGRRAPLPHAPQRRIDLLPPAQQGPPSRVVVELERAGAGDDPAQVGDLEPAFGLPAGDPHHVLHRDAEQVGRAAQRDTGPLAVGGEDVDRLGVHHPLRLALPVDEELPHERTRGVDRHLELESHGSSSGGSGGWSARAGGGRDVGSVGPTAPVCRFETGPGSGPETAGERVGSAPPGRAEDHTPAARTDLCSDPPELPPRVRAPRGSSTALAARARPPRGHDQEGRRCSPRSTATTPTT